MRSLKENIVGNISNSFDLILFDGEGDRFRLPENNNNIILIIL
jgi:hypothetical protein